MTTPHIAPSMRVLTLAHLQSGFRCLKFCLQADGHKGRKRNAGLGGDFCLWHLLLGYAGANSKHKRRFRKLGLAMKTIIRRQRERHGGAGRTLQSEALLRAFLVATEQSDSEVLPSSSLPAVLGFPSAMPLLPPLLRPPLHLTQKRQFWFLPSFSTCRKGPGHRRLCPPRCHLLQHPPEPARKSEDRRQRIAMACASVGRLDSRNVATAA